MTISIEGARYRGDRPGDPIIDPLIGSIPCAVARATGHLNATAQPITRVTLSVVPSASYRNGDLIEVRDSAQGGSWRGKITSVRHRYSGPADIDTELTINRHEPPR